MKPSIAIAMSGGVDSLVAAYLLKNRGHSIFGLHFITGYEKNRYIREQLGNETDHDGHKAGDCIDVTDMLTNHPIHLLANQLNIPLYLADCRHLFQRKVVDYFCRTYAAGLTPNPCLVCNPSIKFGSLFTFACKKGASALATGHYARVLKGADNRYHLLKGIDTAKDQSYFLAFLNQEQLSRAIFPLGVMTKDAVYQLAREKNLSPIVSDESQDICFIKRQSYGDFLVKDGNITPTDGPIINLNGNVIGIHHGLHLFTIGQRKGINCPAAEPYYVVDIDPVKNQLTVGAKTDLLTMKCRLEDINWIQKPVHTPCELETKLRYRHRAVPATLQFDENQRGVLYFQSPQASVTPGQGAVFFQGQEVMGGGWISR
ncbi:MAG: tRNA 2-thiouridine(34) synthase MnmA [Desulfobacterales bacterium]|jgi:tRNA-specific 2-thiouridylase|nr:tRNA 2-thiouridine(34) synthase MnmA [Desulfobacterales bacterium]